MLLKALENRLIIGRKARARHNMICQANTCHGLVEAHLSEWKRVDLLYNVCEEDEEYTLNLWRECPALAGPRLGLVASRVIAKLTTFTGSSAWTPSENRW